MGKAQSIIVLLGPTWLTTKDTQPRPIETSEILLFPGVRTLKRRERDFASLKTTRIVLGIAFQSRGGIISRKDESADGAP